MAVATIYSGHSVNVYPDSLGAAVLIGAITQMDCDIGSEVNSEETAGSYYAPNTNLKAQKPKITFSTRDVKKAIDTIGLTGLAITSATNSGVTLYQQKIVNGVVASGSNHKKIRLANGRLMIRSLSVNHQDDAQIDCEAMAIWDGTNAPLIPSASDQALPSGLADPARYTLHSVSIGGVAIPGIQNLNIDFGGTVDSIGGDSDVWDGNLLLSKLQAIITFGTNNSGQFLTSGGIALQGLIGTHANTTIKLRKRLSGSTPFVADATAEHIVMTTAGLLTLEKAFGASGNKVGQSTYKLTTRYDGTNAPITFSTTSALT